MGQEALTTCEEALVGSLDRQREPLLWGVARVCRGFGLLASATGPGDHRIELAQAQVALAESLELTREQSPLVWSLTQDMMAAVLIALNGGGGSADHLKDAVDALNQALTVQTRACTPLYWAATQQQMGVALTLLGQSENNIGDLRKAENAYHAELDVHTNEDFPYDWATAQIDLSSVLSVRGEREHDPLLVCQALYRALLCQVINKYCARPGAQNASVAYATLKSVFDEHDRQECQAKLESKFGKLPFDLAASRAEKSVRPHKRSSQ
jgi:hypothetical protein